LFLIGGYKNAGDKLLKDILLYILYRMSVNYERLPCSYCGEINAKYTHIRDDDSDDESLFGRCDECDKDYWNDRYQSSACKYYDQQHQKYLKSKQYQIDMALEEELRLEEEERQKRLAEKRAKAAMTGWSFLTLSPDHNLRGFNYNSGTIEQLKNWCKLWFKLIEYEEYAWIIESGKHEDKPHLHIHAMVKLRKGKSGHHKRDLCNHFNSFFPNHQLIGDDYHLVKCNTPEITNDKFNYMINDRKGSHINFEDLTETHNAYGVEGVITTKKITPNINST
jgi:hypothetical protein